VDDTSAREHYTKLERMYLSADANRYYAPSIRIERSFCEVSIEVRSDFFHSAGATHGSVCFKLLDDSAYFAASSLDARNHLVTTQFTIHFVRPVNRGILRAEGSVVYRTQRITVAEAKAFDYKNRLVATGSGSFIPSQSVLSERVGYV
jgi:uncharacterized protein (TIGR00369 family)